jgi:hypothetical protein
MKARHVARAFAAYRGDWPLQRAFFERHGFQVVREMINYVMDFAEMPTPSARVSQLIRRLTVDDLPAVLAMAPSALRVKTVAELEDHLFHNPYFSSEGLFAHCGRGSGPPLAVSVAIGNAAYAHPKQVDAAMPCFRLGAFGTEGLTTKRIKGMFSFLSVPDHNAVPFALDLLGFAAIRLDEAGIGAFAAQAPSDAAHLVRFYNQYFRRQGGFPIFERAL